MNNILKNNWNGKIHHHSIEEHPKVGKAAKFESLGTKIWLRDVVYEKYNAVKLANFGYFYARKVDTFFSIAA